jgi:hypothetical protein
MNRTSELGRRDGWGARALQALIAASCLFTGACTGQVETAPVTAAPVTIPGGGSPFQVVVDATNVYWTTGGVESWAVMKCSVDGCGDSPTTLASGLTQLGGLVVDATRVYWTSTIDGTVMSCPIDGCNGHPTPVASGQVGPMGIAVSAAGVFWSNNDAQGTLMTCPIEGCSGAPAQVIAGSSPGPVAVDETTLYLTTSTSVMKCPIAGCSAGQTQLALDQTNPYLVAVDATDVYWGTGDMMGSTLWKCAIDGCGNSPTQVVAMMPAGGIAVDASGAYWTSVPDDKDYTVMTCAASSCPGGGTALLHTSDFLSGIAVDATSLYVADATGNVIKKIPK